MIRKLVLLTVLLASISILQMGCGSDKSENGTDPPPPPEPRLIADTHQDPTLDNALDSPVWDSIAVLSVPIGNENAYNANLLYINNKFVQMKALVADDSLLYIWARWEDNDEDNRFGQLRATWVSNTVEWAVHYPEDTSEAAFNEDRFYIVFDNDGTNGADCAAFCHSPGSESADGRLFYGAAGDDADVWHWKANRTGLAKLADDMLVTATRVEADAQNHPSDSLYQLNYSILQATGPNSYIVRPLKMHHDGPAYEGPGLLESEIPVQQAGIFTDYQGGSQWINFLPPPSPPVGKSVPGYLIFDESGHDGSRWDVGAVSNHNGVTWTVVFRRALTTNDAADIDFNFSSLDSVEVSIAITDNSGIQHYGRRPFFIIFP
jgi:hypothetical protein